MDAPIRYARSGDVNIAYQVTGEGAFDLVLVSGFVSHLDHDWEHPSSIRLLERLGSFARLIRFDKRGTGLSDRAVGLPDFEARMDDVRAVMDAVGSERAALFGYSEGGPLAMLFAATFPERTRSLVLIGSFARLTRTDDHPWGITAELAARAEARMENHWDEPHALRQVAPGRADDPDLASWWASMQR
ncbi:MAG: hypothetical protein QOI17_1446, partial [Gaiellales bacterium]|nr:hypothetical protein [Gaiellales bacterium]